MINVLIYTQQYPENKESNDGIFTLQLATELNKIINLVVVKPIPVNPLKYLLSLVVRGQVKLHTINNVRQYNVLYLHVPFIFRWIQPNVQLFSMKNVFKDIITNNKINIINAHFLFPDGVTGALLKKYFNKRLVLTALGSDVNVFNKKYIYKKQIQSAVELSDKVVFVSRQLKDNMPVPLSGESKYTVINNGINKEKFYYDNEEYHIFRNQLNLNDYFNILYVGRLHKIKGLDYLLEAYKEIYQAAGIKTKLHLIGDGPEYATLNERIIECGLQAYIIMHGSIEHDEINKYMKSCDLFCLPSINEGQPNVVIEALACGLPVVATRVGGIPDLINDENGQLVNPGDSLSLAKAITNTININYNRQAISDNLPVSSWAEIAESYNALYKEVINY